MLSKGAYKSHEGDGHRSHYGHRIEQVEKELAESKVISAEVPGLRKTYVGVSSTSVKTTKRLSAFKISVNNFRARKSGPRRWSNFVKST